MIRLMCFLFLSSSQKIEVVVQTKFNHLGTCVGFVGGAQANLGGGLTSINYAAPERIRIFSSTVCNSFQTEFSEKHL